MQLQQLQKRKHLFKKRYNQIITKKKNLKYGTIGLKLLQAIRYELVYFRFFKKVFKQRHMRRKMSFRRAKFWVLLNLNYILTNKSTNSRMGSGVGSIVRVAIRLKQNTIFIETLGFTGLWISKVYKKLRFKYPFKFLVVYCRFW